MSETAFEKWWQERCENDYKFPNEKSFVRGIARFAWNAAIDAAINECDNWIKIMEGSCGYGLDDCKAEIQKLRSE